MKRLSYAIGLACLLSTIIFAQDEQQIRWRLVNLPEEGFSLEVPEGFRYGKLERAENKIEARGDFQNDRERLFIFVDAAKRPRHRRQVEAYLRLEDQVAAPFDFGVYKAAKAEFRDSTGYIHRVLLIQTDRVLYTLHTVTRENHSEAALRFLNGFRIIQNGAAGENSVAPTIFSLEAGDVKSVSQKESSSSATPSNKLVSTQAIAGNGQGSGSGTDSATPSVPPPSRVLTGLKILFKEKAKYTDFARFYGIRGTVTLRVTFLSSGKIGSITKIRSLPFGLTESAISAAVQMRFEPELVNGVARNTSRPVSFTFDIY
jgi:TonB family protein